MGPAQTRKFQGLSLNIFKSIVINKNIIHVYQLAMGGINFKSKKEKRKVLKLKLFILVFSGFFWIFYIQNVNNFSSS